jgi:oligo-1,6-glucosidase
MEKAWWKESVVYQIYPRSFMDSNGDGIGDLRGIISKLDYLKNLGIDVIWLSPVYESPNDDNGYDISDYQGIMKEFGTMEDFDELLHGAHERGMKIVMDLVVNHSSDEHRWFIESRKSKDNPFRDYYIWKPGKDGEPPVNWGSVFGGSAWEYDEQTGEYYLHIFSKKQPDLNWENEKVRKEIYQMMTWWLDKGIDGFRMDVINFISKDPDFPDGPLAKGEQYGDGSQYFMNGPRIHEFLQEMNKEVLSKYDVMTVGEMPGVDAEEGILYTGAYRNELNMVFQFEHVDVGNGPHGKWTPRAWNLTELKGILAKWQYGLAEKGWNSLYWNNHDQPRAVSRFGNDQEFYDKSAKMLATCLHMMRGTPYIYQGEELGMTNVAFEEIHDYRDIETLNMYREAIASGESIKEIMNVIHERGRDNARTPVQWDDSMHAGFTSGTPWIKVNPNYREINAKQALANPESIFHYYKKLIQLRKQNEIVVYGNFQLIYEDSEKIFAYTRTLDKEKWMIVCSFSTEPAVFTFPEEVRAKEKEIIIGNYEDKGKLQDSFELQPYQAIVIKLT